MDFLLSRVNMAEVRQAPVCDHVMWSASFQTSGGLRRHSEKDFDPNMTLFVPSRTKSAVSWSQHRSESVTNGPPSWRSPSRQSFTSERFIDSARTKGGKYDLHKELSSPALLTMSNSAQCSDYQHGPGDKKASVPRCKNLRRSKTCIFSPSYRNTFPKRRSLQPDMLKFRKSKVKNAENNNEESNVINAAFRPASVNEKLPALSQDSVPNTTKVRPKGNKFNSGKLKFQNCGTILNYPCKNQAPCTLFRGQERPKKPNISCDFRRTINKTTASNTNSNMANKQTNKPPDYKNGKPPISIIIDSSSSDCSSDLDIYLENFSDFDDDDNSNDCFAHLTWRSESDEDSASSVSRRMSYRERRRKRKKEKERKISSRTRSASSGYLSRSNTERRSTPTGPDGYSIKNSRHSDNSSKNSNNSNRKYGGNSSRYSSNSSNSGGSVTSHNSKFSSRRQQMSPPRKSSFGLPDSRAIRREMQKRFAQEAWYQKALRTLKEMPAYESKVKDNHRGDPDEIAKRLCRQTASSRAREAATCRYVLRTETEKVEKSAKTPRKSVTIDFVNVDNLMRFKGQRHVSSSEMQSIISRLSECDPKQVPEAQRMVPREDLHTVGIMNTAMWRGENRFQREIPNSVATETLIMQLRRS